MAILSVDILGRDLPIARATSEARMAANLARKSAVAGRVSGAVVCIRLRSQVGTPTGARLERCLGAEDLELRAR